MALREILRYPDPRLRAKSEEVTRFDQTLGQLIDDMAESMYTSDGVGLAAPQVGVSLRVVVIDAGDESGGSRLLELVNPRITDSKGLILFDEGCLSFPGIREDVERASWVRVEAVDRQGRPVSVEGEGVLAVALQHEIDHLDGVLLIDFMSFLKRRMTERKLSKQEP